MRREYDAFEAMHWITPSEKDIASGTLGKRLWEAADQFRANSGLTSHQYSLPAFGLIFLRFAEPVFATQRAKLAKDGFSLRCRSSADYPTAYHVEEGMLDSARGSSGIFVEFAYSVAKHRKNPHSELSTHGVGMAEETAGFCCLNLALQGLQLSQLNSPSWLQAYKPPEVSLSTTTGLRALVGTRQMAM